MSIKGLLRAIQDKVDHEIAVISCEMERDVARVIAEANAHSYEMHAKGYAEGLSHCESECKRLLHSAQYEARQTVESAREALIQNIFALLEDRLTVFQQDAEYAAYLVALIEEALTLLKPSLAVDEIATIHCDARDEVWVQNWRSMSADPVNLEADITCWGGVIATSTDGKVIVSNTLNTRLERARPYARWFIAHQLDTSDPLAVAETPIKDPEQA